MTETTSHRTPGGALLTKTRVYDYRVVKPTRDFSTEFFVDVRRSARRTFVLRVYVFFVASSSFPRDSRLRGYPSHRMPSSPCTSYRIPGLPRGNSHLATNLAAYPPAPSKPSLARGCPPSGATRSTSRHDTLRHRAGPSPREEIAVPRGGAHRSGGGRRRRRRRVARSARAPGGFRHDDGRATPSAQFLQFRRGRVVHRVQRQRRALFSPRRAIQPVKRGDVIHQQKPTRRRRRRVDVSPSRLSSRPSRGSPPPTSSPPPRSAAAFFASLRSNARSTTCNALRKSRELWHRSVWNRRADSAYASSASASSARVGGSRGVLLGRRARDGVFDARGENFEESECVEFAVEVEEEDAGLASAETHAAALAGHDAVDRGAHENLRLAAAADAAHLEELAGAERAVVVHEGDAGEHGVNQHAREERGAWGREATGTREETG